MAAGAPQDQPGSPGPAEGPAGERDWLIAPPVPDGTTIELTTVISADGLTAEAFSLLARLAATHRDKASKAAANGPSCPSLLTCDVFHDHGQPCPQLTYCGVNTTLAPEAKSPD